MAQVRKTFKTAYIAGETATVEVYAPGAASVSVSVDGAATALDGADGVFSARLATASLRGSVRHLPFLSRPSPLPACETCPNMLEYPR